MRKFKTVDVWRKEIPGARAYIFQTPEGVNILVMDKKEAPPGNYALLGIIE